MVSMFGNFSIDPWVGILKDHVFKCFLVPSLPLEGREEAVVLTKSGEPSFFSFPTTDMRSPHLSVLDRSGVLCHFDLNGALVS